MIISITFNCKNDLAFNAVTTFFPGFASYSFIATLTTSPPCYVTFLLSSKVAGLVAFEISLADASAKKLSPIFAELLPATACSLRKICL